MSGPEAHQEQHKHGDAGEPECRCYVLGWEFGYLAGEAAVRDELDPDGEEEAAGMAVPGQPSIH
jgi:hypothetical protein